VGGLQQTLLQDRGHTGRWKLQYTERHDDPSTTYKDDEGTQTFTSPDAAEPPILNVTNVNASNTASSIPLSIMDTAVDGDDTLLPVTISGLPTNWTLNDDASAPLNLGNGTWSVPLDALSSLVILPPAGGFDQGAIKLTVIASNLDADGAETETLSTSASLLVTIDSGANAGEGGLLWTSRPDGSAASAVPSSLNAFGGAVNWAANILWSDQGPTSLLGDGGSIGLHLTGGLTSPAMSGAGVFARL
jgi:hypothetical protein